MAKFIIFLAAAALFWWYASGTFEETFGEDKARIDAEHALEEGAETDTP